MGKRASNPPRRPRDPVAKAVRPPRFEQQELPDKRWRERPPEEKPASDPKPGQGDEAAPKN